MAVVATFKDSAALTLTLVAEFDAGVERVWQVWEDPRQLERWWGPPTWPATFERHEFVVGGKSAYYMTGPEGEKSRGWWRITAIEAPHRLEFDDGFADADGEPVTTIEPTHAVVTLDAVGSGTRMTTVTQFTNAEQLEQMLEMGMEEGWRLAVSQIDEVLGDSAR
ncbi:SRPBCC domain-containing protein [Micromonospora sp. NPDC050417]|uniref:SRPBCC domain-containing protein n=1 Tax=Micromonospora sp. NPDC050417 TaxID=3364280 RepID=UPI0037A9F14D